jgi:hypothetical protein
MKERIQSIFNNNDDVTSLKSRITQWVGYGSPDFNKVLECRDGRATLLGYGQLNDKEAHVFHLPLPLSLGGRQIKRKLTITLSWISPTVPTTQKYRVAGLWFDLDLTPLNLKRKEVDWQTVKKGTVQHEIFEGERTVLPFSEGDALDIRVNCKVDVGSLSSPIRYGLAVSLEVAEGIDVPIYDEIRTRIAPTVQIRAGAPQNT